MGKKERIQVQLSAETLVLARAKTELRGLSMSGYIRGLIMVDLSSGGCIGILEKKSNPTDISVSYDVVDRDEFDENHEVPLWKRKLDDKKDKG